MIKLLCNSLNGLSIPMILSFYTLRGLTISTWVDVKWKKQIKKTAIRIKSIIKNERRYENHWLNWKEAVEVVAGRTLYFAILVLRQWMQNKYHDKEHKKPLFIICNYLPS